MARHRVDELGNANKYAICWVDSTIGAGRVQTTIRHDCYINMTTGMTYNYDRTWTGPCELRGHAAFWGAGETWIKGWVDFG